MSSELDTVAMERLHYPYGHPDLVTLPHDGTTGFSCLIGSGAVRGWKDPVMPKPFLHGHTGSEGRLTSRRGSKFNPPRRPQARVVSQSPSRAGHRAARVGGGEGWGPTHLRMLDEVGRRGRRPPPTDGPRCLPLPPLPGSITSPASLGAWAWGLRNRGLPHTIPMGAKPIHRDTGPAISYTVSRKSRLDGTTACPMCGSRALHRGRESASPATGYQGG